MRGHLGIGESFGVVSLAFATQNVRYPCTSKELMRKIGHRKIFWNRNTVVDLKGVLANADAQEFGSFVDLLSAVSHHEDPHVRKITEFM